MRLPVHPISDIEWDMRTTVDVYRHTNWSLLCISAWTLCCVLLTRCQQRCHIILDDYGQHLNVPMLQAVILMINSERDIIYVKDLNVQSGPKEELQICTTPNEDTDTKTDWSAQQQAGVFFFVEQTKGTCKTSDKFPGWNVNTMRCTVPKTSIFTLMLKSSTSEKKKICLQPG